MREYLYQALASPLGIELISDDVERCIQKLQQARRDSGDPDLKLLVIMRGRRRTDSVWIGKKEVPQNMQNNEVPREET